VRIVVRAFAVDVDDRQPGHASASLDNSAAISRSRPCAVCW
jgi:hypothetical protein